VNLALLCSQQIFFLFFFLGALFRYIGVSSSGMTYKSGTPSFSSASSHSSNRYGGFGSGGDRFSDSYGDKGRYDEAKVDKDYSGKSRYGASSYDEENSFKKGSARSVR
jgi:epsin